MRILFAISMLCFLVLVWAAVAITRRIRTGHKHDISSDHLQGEFGQYLFAAVERDHAPLAQMTRPSLDFHNISVSNSANQQSPARSRAGIVDKTPSYHRE